MTKDEFEYYIYSDLPIEYKEGRIGICGTVMFNEIYVFGITIVDKKLGNHYKYLSLIDPEIICEYDDYKLSKEDIDELNNILIDDGGWNKIIESMHLCIKSDNLTDDYLKIDFNKIPSSPPDYSLLI